MQKLSIPQGDFVLTSHPSSEWASQRAWNAADEYLLHHLHDQQLPPETSILILNDAFGAISIALAGHLPHVVSDWKPAHNCIAANLKNNTLDAGQIKLHNSLNYPDQKFDIVLIRLPKSLAMLEDQLHRVAACLHAESQVIAFGMAKHIHTSTLKLFEKVLGPTKTSLARKKARLIFCTPENASSSEASPFPVTWTYEDWEIVNHAGVFSPLKLDIGARFFLDHLPASDQAKDIIDLGCGNGVLALKAAKLNPQANILCCDASFMAIDAAQQNLERAYPSETHRFSYQVTDCLQGIADNSADLILNNPPFHQDHAISNTLSLRMFKEAHRVLRKGGELRVVGNKHLGYHARLKEIFGNFIRKAENKKFLIGSSFKR